MLLNRKKFLSFVFLLSLAFIIAFGINKYTSPQKAQAQSSPQMYWGAWAGGAQYGKSDAPFDMTTLDQFETNAGKQVSILRWGQPLFYNGSFMAFPTNNMNKVRNHGSVALLDWGIWNRCPGCSFLVDPAFRHATIAAGTYDQEIRTFADGAAAWGYPFFLRLDPELNGWWYLLGEGRDAAGNIVNGNNAGDHKLMWRHVWNVFNCIDDGIFHPEAGCQPVTNATWVWSINIMSTQVASNGLPRYPVMSQIYPGDQYVDWTGVSLYNKNTSSLSFNALFTGSEGQTWLQNTYQVLSGIAPSKPMMLAEYASWEYNNNPAIKANWISDAVGTQIIDQTRYPLLKAAVWYNTNDEWGNTGYAIETSPQSTDAFKTAIANNAYSANILGNLPAGTKIQPLTGSFPTNTPSPSPTPVSGQTYVSDFFTRTVSGSWGTADTGGLYTLQGTTSDFSVSGGAGNMNVPAVATQRVATLGTVNVLDSDTAFRVKTDKVPSGGDLLISQFLRNGTAGQYRITLRPNGGNIYVHAQKYLTSTGLTSDLTAKQLVSGLIQTAGNYIWIRSQIEGINPVNLRIKVWADGQSEPATWQYTASDSSAEQITGSGSVGILSRTLSTVTNVPILFSYDDYQVTDIQSTPVPTATLAPTSSPTPTPLTAIGSVAPSCNVDNQQEFTWTTQPGAVDYWVQAWNDNPTPTWYLNNWLGGPTPAVSFYAPGETITTRVAWTNDPAYSNISAFSPDTAAFCPLPSPTPSNTPTPTNTPSPTPTFTPTPTYTPTPTNTPIPTPTDLPTPTLTPTPTNTPSPTPTPGLTYYVSDIFNRTVSGSWGSALTGGSYSLQGSTGDFTVNGSEGTMNIPAVGTQRVAVLDSVNTLDSDTTFRIKTDKVPQGGDLFISQYLRNGSLGQYRITIRPNGGNIYVHAQKYLTSTGLTTDMTAKQLMSGLTHIPDSYIWIRGQIVGINPTILRIKAWADGQEEPIDWQYTANDSTDQITDPGSVGLLSRTSATLTNIPFQFTYDDYRVSSIGTATPLNVIGSIAPSCNINNQQQFTWADQPEATDYWVQAWNNNPSPTWYINDWMGGPVNTVSFSAPGETINTRVAWTNTTDYSNVSSFSSAFSAFCPLPSPTPSNTPTPTYSPTPTYTPTPTLTPSPTPVPSSNMFLNPGFEFDADANTSPDYWTINSRFTRSNEAFYTGSYSGKHFSPSNANYNVSQKVLGVTQNTPYRFSGRVRIPATNDKFTITFQVKWLNSTSNVIATIPIESFISSNSIWQLTSANIISPPGAAQARLEMIFKSFAATAYVDDFYFGQ